MNAVQEHAIVFEEAATKVIDHLENGENVLMVVPRDEHITMRKRFNLFILETVYGVNCPTEKDLEEMQTLVTSFLKSRGSVRFVDNVNSMSGCYPDHIQVQF